MGADLRLDLAELHQLWGDLARISQQFGKVDGIGTALSEAVGHPGLRARLQEFGRTWDDRRELLVMDLDTVWRAVQAVEETFAESDVVLQERLQSTEGGSR